MPVDNLGSYGINRMDDAEIETFLSEQSVGVLSIPAEVDPVLRPMSFSFEQPGRLYFLYILTTGSQKQAATERSDVAQFLVYTAKARHDWTSVLLTGTIDAVPESERGAIEEQIDLSWRPEAFEQVRSSKNTELYEFEITEQTGLKQRGPPPGTELEL